MWGRLVLNPSSIIILQEYGVFAECMYLWWLIVRLNNLIAGSFKSQLIDYFRGYIVSWEAFDRFMLIRIKWHLWTSWHHFGCTLWCSQLLYSWRNFYFLYSFIWLRIYSLCVSSVQNQKESTTLSMKPKMAIFQSVFSVKGPFTLCIFYDCDCDLVYRKKWIVQDSMEVFTLCHCENITNSFVAHCEQKTNRSGNQKKSHSVNEPLLTEFTVGSAIVATLIASDAKGDNVVLFKQGEMHVKYLPHKCKMRWHSINLLDCKASYPLVNLEVSSTVSWRNMVRCEAGVISDHDYLWILTDQMFSE